MKLIHVTDAQGEAEALMFLEMLRVEGIKGVKVLPSNQQFLRSYYGGAALPSDVWEIRVTEEDAAKAKLILPELEQNPDPQQEPNIEKNKSVIVADTPPAMRKMSIMMLGSIILGLIFTLIEMIKYFLN
mgnify:CR=1 FL=1